MCVKSIRISHLNALAIVVKAMLRNRFCVRVASLFVLFENAKNFIKIIHLL